MASDHARPKRWGPVRLRGFHASRTSVSGRRPVVPGCRCSGCRAWSSGRAGNAPTRPSAQEVVPSTPWPAPGRATAPTAEGAAAAHAGGVTGSNWPDSRSVGMPLAPGARSARKPLPGTSQTAHAVRDAADANARTMRVACPSAAARVPGRERHLLGALHGEVHALADGAAAERRAAEDAGDERSGRREVVVVGRSRPRRAPPAALGMVRCRTGRSNRNWMTTSSP